MADGGVEDHQFAHPRHAVVACDDAGNLCRMAGHRASVEQAVGPERVAAVQRHLPRAVRVHLEEYPRIGVRQARVLPPQVHDVPVRQDRRAPVVVLVERQPADVARSGLQQVQVRHLAGAADARHADHRRRRGEHYVAVRQVARVVVAHVAVADKLQLARRAARDGHLVHAPDAFGVRRTEQHPRAVEVQVHVADEPPAAGAVERRELPAAPPVGHHGQVVVVTRLAKARVALPIGGQAEVLLAAPHDEQLLEVQQGI